jgi:hypothetical protein
MALTPRLRLRRVGKLCCLYLKNHAYYRAGFGTTAPQRQGHFWTNVINNCFDQCVLEFCKLFAETRGRHHWRKVVSDPTAFVIGLLASLGMNEAELNEYIQTFRFYRNKYLAHLDEETTGNFPLLGPGKDAVSYLYDYILKHEDEGDFFLDASATAADFYADRKEEAAAIYE